MKKYWNSGKYVLGLRQTNTSSRENPILVLIISIVFFIGYLLWFQMIMPTFFLENLLFGWVENNIVKGSTFEHIILIVMLIVGFLALMHFLIIMFQWFQYIYEANKK